jgi:hypothetical protein
VSRSLRSEGFKPGNRFVSFVRAGEAKLCVGARGMLCLSLRKSAWSFPPLLLLLLLRSLRNGAQPVRLYFIKKRLFQILRTVPQPDQILRTVPQQDPAHRALHEQRTELRSRALDPR